MQRHRNGEAEHAGAVNNNGAIGDSEERGRFTERGVERRRDS